MLLRVHIGRRRKVKASSISISSNSLISSIFLYKYIATLILCQQTECYFRFDRSSIQDAIVSFFRFYFFSLAHFFSRWTTFAMNNHAHGQITQVKAFCLSGGWIIKRIPFWSRKIAATTTELHRLKFYAKAKYRKLALTETNKRNCSNWIVSTHAFPLFIHRNNRSLPNVSAQYSFANLSRVCYVRHSAGMCN